MRNSTSDVAGTPILFYICSIAVPLVPAVERQMTTIRYVLRDLPGVSEVEELLKKIEAHPNPAWAPENDNLPKISDRVSQRLFGITQDETWLDDADISEDDWGDAWEAWESNFRFAQEYFDDGGDDAAQDAKELEISALMGWDVTDGTGNILNSLGQFQRQIICASKGMRGRLPDAEMTDEETLVMAERWGQSLRAKGSRC